MRFLADHNIARSTVEALLDLGHEVTTLRSVGLQAAEDGTVINFAKKNNFILITFDQDFADLLSYSPNKYSGIIVLKIPSELPKVVNSTLKRFLMRPQLPKLSGKLIVLEPTRFRLRE